jgi:two-component system, NtrC family, response regulator HydG
MKITDFSDEVLEIFRNYEWPGNIRELKNVIKRAVLLSPNEILTPETLPGEIVQFSANPLLSVSNTEAEKNLKTLKNVASGAEKELIIKAIEDAGYNKSKAARNLQIDRKTLYNKIKQYGIDI